MMDENPERGVQAQPHRLADAGSSDPLWNRLPRPLQGWAVAFAAIGITSVSTVLGLILSQWLPHQSIGLLYIPAVVIAAAGLGMWTGVLVAVLASFAYNFFFIVPIWTFSISDPQELFSLFIFVAVALLSGSLAGRMRDMADASGRREVALRSLNELAAKLSAALDECSILGVLGREAARMVEGAAVVFRRAGEGFVIERTTLDEIAIDTADWQAVGRVFRSHETVYSTAAGWPGKLSW